MSLKPNIVELQARARSDLRMGLPVVFGLRGDFAVVASAEALPPSRLDELRNLAPRLILAITARRAETLKARAYSDQVARVVMPADADCGWAKSVADPADDMHNPMKGPLQTLRGGEEGLFRAAITFCKAARLLPAAFVAEVGSDGPELAARYGLTLLDADEAYPVMHDTSPLNPVAAARLPMQAFQAGRLHIFRPEDGGEEHYAVQIGMPDRQKPVLARLHSACFTGDVLGSLKCDCGPQLNAALMQMGAEGAGILLYLNQEGRGIGLANKMRAYSLQDQGFDTVEANHRLGFEDDERDFRIGAKLLERMGFDQVRLLTNNPAKVAMLEGHGIKVTERVPLKVGLNPMNEAYLATKARKSGHLL
ncbi:GTP cyclohydrolase [Actibacterium mucosum KCTC 23349]|uniref:GTP cyclohydrolase-2 n=1 Tax=Actibacterium mucosum KCTC 23349 TaxID=1454373 RepID=A0A037ZPL3_9RHOB|nr:GTP cyclohydrolase II [Actibacterium mucosum]KAJ57468.1 GTP cyclohydrolase [Actibacterium mucosum KCTC 23349]